jgi:hypothetical protein
MLQKKGIRLVVASEKIVYLVHSAPSPKNKLELSKRAVFFMLKKAFIFTLALSVFGTLLYAQPGPPPPSSPPPPGTLTLSPATIPNGVYGSAYAKQTIKATGGKAPYTFSISGGSLPPGMFFSSEGVLSGTATAAGAYLFTIATQDRAHGQNQASGTQKYTLFIDKATLTITANDASMSYGGAIPALTASYSGLVNRDKTSDLTSPATITTMATSSSAAGSYPITASGAVDPNYKFLYNPGTLSIGRAPLLVIAGPETKEFGAVDPGFTFAASGYLNGDNSGIFSGKLSRAAGENVGIYPIAVGSLSPGGNYTIRYTGNNLTITKGSQRIAWTQSLIVGCNASTQVQLTATASSSLPVTYSVADRDIATVSGNVLILLQPGTTVVTATQAGNANYTAASGVSDTAAYQPASLISQHWDDAIFFDNSSGDYVAWQWYKDDSPIPGATGAYYSETPSLDGQYFVIATNKDGQQIHSCTLAISGNAPIPGGIKAYPNPASTGAQVTVTSNYAVSALQNAVLQVVDLAGKVRQQITNIQPTIQVTMPTDNGLYIINLLLPRGEKASTNVLVGG